MSLGEVWVEEVVGRITAHPEPFHHRHGAPVGHGGDRHDLGQAERLERELECRLGRLGREALAPGKPREPPSDLRDRQVLEPGDPGESQERAVVPSLDGPQTVAVRPPSVDDPVDERVARGSIERGREVLHDRRIGVHRGERRPVSVAERAQDEALGLQLGDGRRDATRRSAISRRTRQRASNERFDRP